MKSIHFQINHSQEKYNNDNDSLPQNLNFINVFCINWKLHEYNSNNAKLYKDIK